MKRDQTPLTPLGPLSLGVDGGATKTLAVVVDAGGHERGRGVAGPANHEAVGMEAALRAILAACAAALRESGAGEATPAPVEAAWVGLAGVDRAEDAQRFAAALTGLAPHVHVTNDGALALGALPGGCGVALIAGTGSIALGRSASGATARAGGWGHLIGDEGGAYALGRAALAVTAAALDGRAPASALTEAVTRAWNIAQPGDLIARVYQPFDKRAVAALAPLTLAAAQAGDPVARGILRRETRALAQTARAVAEALALGPALPLALVGGLLTRDAAYRAQTLAWLARWGWRTEPLVVEEPALWAARGARAALAEALSEARGTGRD